MQNRPGLCLLIHAASPLEVVRLASCGHWAAGHPTKYVVQVTAALVCSTGHGNIYSHMGPTGPLPQGRGGTQITNGDQPDNTLAGGWLSSAGMLAAHAPAVRRTAVHKNARPVHILSTHLRRIKPCCLLLRCACWGCARAGMQSHAHPVCQQAAR